MNSKKDGKKNNDDSKSLRIAVSYQQIAIAPGSPDSFVGAFTLLIRIRHARRFVLDVSENSGYRLVIPPISAAHMCILYYESIKYTIHIVFTMDTVMSNAECDLKQQFTFFYIKC